MKAVSAEKVVEAAAKGRPLRFVRRDTNNQVMEVRISVTRLGDLLQFGQIFKATASNYFDKIAHVLGKYCKDAKIFHFSSGIIFGNLFRYLATFYWSR